MNTDITTTNGYSGLSIRIRVADLIHDVPRLANATDSQRYALAAAFTAAADDAGTLRAHDAASHLFAIATTIFRGGAPDAATCNDAMARVNAQLRG